MNARLPALASFVLFAVGALSAQPAIPPPIRQASPAPTLPGLQPGAQRVYGPTADTLIARQTADGIIEGFRKAYHDDAAPRIVIYVNRALVDTTSGLNFAQRTQNYEQTNAVTKSTGINAYAAKDAGSLTLADQQTVREVERLFGRVFRHAGAQLTDQMTATSLLPDKPGEHLSGDAAGKDREALAKIADIAIEVLISSRNISVPQVSGDVSYPVPDIQATAIRLKDAAIVGQAAASDIVGKGVQAGRVVQQFDASDITEATAIALMEDMLTGRK